MKLQANIKPRKDGKVMFSSPSGVVYTFEADAAGYLVCDVKDAGDARAALRTGNFEPVDQQDFAKASQMVASENDEEDDVDQDEPVSNAMPLEANTPPARYKGGRKAK